MSLLRVAAVGDIMCGESFYGYGQGPRTFIARRGADYLDESVRAVWAGYDLVIGNVECPLSNIGYRSHSLRRRHMRGNPEVAPLLAQWGFNVATVANNHILEHGLEAARDTAGKLQAAGISVVGAGRDCQFEEGDCVARVRCGNAIVAVVGACMLKERYAYDGGVPEPRLLDLVTRHASNADFVIVMLHWGKEFLRVPTPVQRDLAGKLVTAGATLIIGSHPHVVQGIERIGSALVAYSLGNFVFDQPLFEARWGAILNCALRPRCLVDYRVVPVRLGTECAPQLVVGEERAVFDSELSQLQRAVDDSTPASLARELQLARERENRFRKNVRTSLWHAARTQGLVYSLQALARPLARRVHRW